MRLKADADDFTDEEKAAFFFLFVKSWLYLFKTAMTSLSNWLFLGVMLSIFTTRFSWT